ncbi:MAG: histidine phosphatase family protein [Oscillospiraceae bacterium]|nr:histidine phosphatase family protein [Oscillospiraceae bacterium]MBP1560681.1 histidine phosphatase family protein [Oscillospiraceae bacterium]
MKIIFIRHGKTLGNLEKRYIGRTDEPLSHIGRNELFEVQYHDCDIVIASPMKRCQETAQMLYPSKKIVTCDGLEECDFGDFEGKSYLELSGNPEYQKWIDSGGKLPFPNGESPEAFKGRCITAFEKAVEKYSDCAVISFVVHGGTIMAVLEKYAVPKRNYYDFQVKNGHGYITEFDGGKITILEQI